jgi:S1-C subfamily serine protease
MISNTLVSFMATLRNMASVERHGADRALSCQEIGSSPTTKVLMHRLLPFAVLLVLLLAPQGAHALELPELAARARPSVVLLTVGDAHRDKAATGTGFFVSKDGRIVTNHHVIDGARKVTATLVDGRTVDIVGLLADDPAGDVAVLQAPPGEYAPLPLGGSAPLRVGEEVVVIGSPLGLSASFSAGVVSALRDRGLLGEQERHDERLAAWAIQITAAVSPGSSGSPIMNRDGEVVGVAVGKASGEALNFGVPVDVPKALLAHLAPDAAPHAFPGGRSFGTLTNLGISALVFGVPYGVYLVLKMRARRRDARLRAARARS